MLRGARCHHETGSFRGFERLCVSQRTPVHPVSRSGVRSCVYLRRAFVLTFDRCNPQPVGTVTRTTKSGRTSKDVALGVATQRAASALPPASIPASGAGTKNCTLPSMCRVRFVIVPFGLTTSP